MPSIPLRGRLFVFLVVAGVSGLFFIDFCDLIYQCGCRSLWDGAAAACNVHTPGNHHCPWCALGVWGGLLSFGPVVAAQALAAFLPSSIGLGSRLAAGLVAFPLVGGAAGLVLGWATGYWS